MLGFSTGGGVTAAVKGGAVEFSACVSFGGSNSSLEYTNLPTIDKIVPKSTVRLVFFVTTSLYVILLDVDSKQRSFTFRKQLI